MPPPATVTPAIIEEVARTKGVDPLELEVPLYTVIDADALDALVTGAGSRDGQGSIRVTFTYQGYKITVDGPNQVSVVKLPEGAGADATSPESTGAD